MPFIFIVLLIATNWCLKMRRHSVLSSQMDKISVKTLGVLLFPNVQKEMPEVPGSVGDSNINDNNSSLDRVT